MHHAAKIEHTTPQPTHNRNETQDRRHREPNNRLNDKPYWRRRVWYGFSSILVGPDAKLNLIFSPPKNGRWPLWMREILEMKFSFCFGKNGFGLSSGFMCKKKWGA
jgi:hypothetical protein